MVRLTAPGWHAPVLALWGLAGVAYLTVADTQGRLLALPPVLVCAVLAWMQRPGALLEITEGRVCVRGPLHARCFAWNVGSRWSLVRGRNGVRVVALELDPDDEELLPCHLALWRVQCIPEVVGERLDLARSPSPATE